jgi:hypothetical protein
MKEESYIYVYEEKSGKSKLSRQQKRTFSKRTLKAGEVTQLLQDGSSE